jgi:hypothetical protein
MSKRKIWLAVALLGLFALSRWPGLLPPNFSAAYALAFCAGAFLPGRLAWWVPMSVLLATDLCLNYHYDAPLLSWYMALNYVGYGVLIGLGSVVRLLTRGRRAGGGAAAGGFGAKSFPRLFFWLKCVAGGFLGAILFYLITNTAAWLNPAPGPFPQEPYAKTLWGWIQALTTGSSPWPPTWTFFWNTLSSGGLFTGIFAGAMTLAGASKPAEEEETEEEEETVPEAEPEKADA